MSAEEQPRNEPESEPIQPPETPPQEDDEGQPDLLVWGILALVILGGLTWLVLARRPSTPPPVAMPGGSVARGAAAPPRSSPALASPMLASRPGASASPANPARPGASASPAQPARPGASASPGPSVRPAQPKTAPSPRATPPRWAPAGLPDPAASPPGPPPVAAVPPDGTGAPIMYVGSEPTTDPRSWTYIHGDILLGALREVDANPSTTFTPQQLRSLEGLLTDVQDASEDLGPASVDFVTMAQGVLEPRQMAGMTANEERLCAVTPDLDGLIARLEKLAASAPPKRLPPPQVTQAVYPANFLVSGLAWLETFPRAPLSAEQAARLLPSLKIYARSLRKLTAFYQRLPQVLSPGQTQAFRAVLADMRVSQNPPLEERHLTLAEMQLYLAERLER